jgi:hypothetical protein
MINRVPYIGRIIGKIDTKQAIGTDFHEVRKVGKWA